MPPQKKKRPTKPRPRPLSSPDDLSAINDMEASVSFDETPETLPDERVEKGEDDGDD